MVSEKQVLDALKEVYDPEIPVNVVDLGLIYDIKIDQNSVEIKMTLTAVGCPMHAQITQNVKSRIETMDGVDKAVVGIVWEPRWNPEMISPAGRKALGME